MRRLAAALPLVLAGLASVALAGSLPPIEGGGPGSGAHAPRAPTLRRAQVPASLAPAECAGGEPPSHAAAAGATPFERADVRAICEKIVCYCGCPHLQVSKCFCGTADEIRAEVAAGLDAGRSDEQVIEAYLAEHGTWALAVPPREGFNWSIWLAPVVALVLGGGLVLTLGRRWARQGPSAVPLPSSASLGDERTARYREELSRAIAEED